MRLPPEKSVMMESLAVENAGTSRELLLRRSRESARNFEMESALATESLFARKRLSRLVADESLTADIRLSREALATESGAWRNTLAWAQGATKAAHSARARRYFRKFPFIQADFLLYLCNI
jgi:hypothetical protein